MVGHTHVEDGVIQYKGLAYSEDLDLLAELFRLRQQYHKENLRRLFGTR